MAGALVLIGFMGAGKTSAARALHPAALDTDAEIEAPRRDVDPRALRPARRGGVPRAGGGGRARAARPRGARHPGRARRRRRWAPSGCGPRWPTTSSPTWRSTRRPPGRARRRDGATRPLARDRERFAALLRDAAARLRGGRRRVPAAGRAARAPSRRCARCARAPSSLWGPHPVPCSWATTPGPSRRDGDFLVTDEHVGALHGERFAGAARATSSRPASRPRRSRPPRQVWTAMARAGVTRAGRVVALGGGVVGDLAGFCAATYQRGIPVVQVPDDARRAGRLRLRRQDRRRPAAGQELRRRLPPAAGGPRRSPAVLRTLPPEERAAGYAEVVKTALIAGGALWERVPLRRRAVDGDAILACARTKLAVVAADERDGGVRQMLNLGHTVGHAIETVTGYARYRHGEAVGLGLLAALRLSGQDALRDEVRGLLAGARAARRSSIPRSTPARSSPRPARTRSGSGRTRRSSSSTGPATCGPARRSPTRTCSPRTSCRRLRRRSALSRATTPGR